jgi:hypothetical protein
MMRLLKKLDIEVLSSILYIKALPDLFNKLTANSTINILSKCSRGSKVVAFIASCTFTIEQVELIE